MTDDSRFGSLAAAFDRGEPLGLFHATAEDETLDGRFVDAIIKVPDLLGRGR